MTSTFGRYNHDYAFIPIGCHDHGVGARIRCDFRFLHFSANVCRTPAPHSRRICVVPIRFGSDGLATVVRYIQSRMVNGGE
jgi:hypothetical protein